MTPRGRWLNSCLIHASCLRRGLDKGLELLGLNQPLPKPSLGNCIPSRFSNGGINAKITSMQLTTNVNMLSLANAGSDLLTKLFVGS